MAFRKERSEKVKDGDQINSGLKLVRTVAWVREEI